MSGSVPVGTVMMYAGDTTGSAVISLLTAGWLVCDGSKYRRTSSSWSPLFTIIGNAYGGDDNNFCVPLYKGLFLRGVTGASGADPDSASRTVPRPDLAPGQQGNQSNAVGSVQSHQLQSHSHSYNQYSSLHDCDHVAAHDTTNEGTTTANMGSTGGSETRPANIYVNFIIKYLPNDEQIPIGAVLPFAGALPAGGFGSGGWLPCDGAGLDQSQYSDLFEVLSSFYGADGSTFLLPDYRGRFLRGVQGTAITGQPQYDPDAASRTAPTTQPTPGNSGNKVGSIQADDLAAHLHTYAYNDDYQWTAATLIGFSGVAHDAGTSTSTSGASGGGETRPTNINVNYLIKAQTVA